MSRLATIGDGTNTQAAYTYLGSGTIVKESHPGITGGLNLDYDSDADNSCNSLVWCPCARGGTEMRTRAAAAD